MQFDVGEASVKRWVRLHRRDGDVTPTATGGGTHSTTTLGDLEAGLATVRDATAGELTAEFNRSRRRRDRVHVSSIKRALRRRHGYVEKKKRRRPLESLRPDVLIKRAAFLRKIRRVPVDRLVFLDESGMNL